MTTPETTPVDDSYPRSWTPRHIRDLEARIDMTEAELGSPTSATTNGPR